MLTSDVAGLIGPEMLPSDPHCRSHERLHCSPELLHCSHELLQCSYEILADNFTSFTIIKS